MKDRRRYFDSTPRATYATNTIVGRTKLVQRNGYAHIALLALGFTVLIAEDDFVLMQAPAGWEVAQERTA